LTGGLAADDVADGKKERSLLASFLHGCECVGRFSGLCDADRDSLGVDDGVAVSEFGVGAKP
jgi:hypothetical protein